MVISMATTVVVLVSALCTLTSAEPRPQFRPSGYHGGPRQYPQSPRNSSFALPKSDFGFLDPATSPLAEEVIKSHAPRQAGLYGTPFGYPGQNNNQFPTNPQQGYPQGFPSGPAFPGYQRTPGTQGFQGPQGSQGFQGSHGFQSSQGYPQIYKVDNLIIIANPPQQQACPQTCDLKPLDKNTFPGTDDDLDNRMGMSDEPTKCTWAIVACCAPGNNDVKYNCFELMGCPGLFLGQNPCTPTYVEAATMAALNFYRSSSNTTASDTNQL